MLVHDGRRRRYLVHQPANLNHEQLPLVLAFHGGLGRAEVQRVQSRMNLVANDAGFIVAYPDGTGRGASRTQLTWNAGSCCGYAVRNRIDDVGFVDTLIDELIASYPVNPRRVYACGMSNGAMLCYRLACELSHRIAAIGPVSGDMGVSGPLPTRPVPLIHFHGLQDQNACFMGGVGRNQVQALPHRSIPDGLAWWRAVNHCEPEPEISENDDSIVESYFPRSGEFGAPVILHKLPQGGHTWPGGVDVTPHFNTGKLVSSVNASALIWEFFSGFEL